jgi:hypothetical protein
MVIQSGAEIRIVLDHQVDRADRVGIDRNIPQLSHADLELVEIEVVGRSSAEVERRIDFEEVGHSHLERVDRIHLLLLDGDLRLRRVPKRLGLLVLSRVRCGSLASFQMTHLALLRIP